MEIRRIIIIDDDPLNNFIFRDTVRRFDPKTEILEFLSAEKGLEFIKTFYPDYKAEKTLLFLDLSMPGMNGWEFLEEFDSLDVMTKNVFIINILTSSINGDDRKRAAYSPYIMEYINKPFTKEILQKVIKPNYSGSYSF